MGDADGRVCMKPEGYRPGLCTVENAPSILVRGTRAVDSCKEHLTIAQAWTKRCIGAQPA